MKRRGLSTLLSGLLASFSLAAAAAPATETILAPGYGRLAFDAPAPGSYRLPVIETAADGTVLDSTSVSLPRDRFWDIQVSKIDSPTRQPLLPGRPASVPLRHTFVNSALATQHSLK